MRKWRENKEMDRVRERENGERMGKWRGERERERERE